MPPLVGIIMGSSSDWETMQHAADTLASLGVAHETRVVSAHRTPDLLFEYASSAAARGLEVIIAGAGGAAHLPGMAASKTTLPVLGVPVESKSLHGLDSLLSIVQMPAGVPVATFAIGRAGAVNAALFAAAIVAPRDGAVRAALEKHRRDQTDAVLRSPDPRGAVQHGEDRAHDARRGGRRRAAWTDARLGGIPARTSVSILDPDHAAPAGQVARLVVNDYDEPSALAELIEGASVATYEFENVPLGTAHWLEERAHGQPRGQQHGQARTGGFAGVFPSSASLAVAQDRIQEKTFFRACGLELVPFAAIEFEGDLERAATIVGFPAVLKTRRLGYDGKGQHVVRDRPGLVTAWEKLNRSPCALEQFVSFEREVSLLACRGRDGTIVTYP